MKYSITNLQTSLTIQLADFLRVKGYDVYWQVAQSTDSQTAGLVSPKATVTLTPEFPAIPQFIVRLKGESADAEQEIVVPAFTLQLVGNPTDRGLIGIGHTERAWEQEVRVDGLAAEAHQQKDFAELLKEFFSETAYKQFEVFDYETDPAAPPALAPVEVVYSHTDWTELVHEVEAIRYYVKATALVTYEE